MKKNTWIVVGLVVVLGLIYFFTRQDKVSVGVKNLELPHLDQSKVDRIEVGGKNKVTLIKENNAWRLEMGEGEAKRLVAADQANVASMLKAIEDLKPSYYVTELADRLKTLGFEPDAAIPLTLKGGGQVLWALVLGNNATNGGRYAKLPDSKDVYVVKTTFWQLIRNNAIDWRDRVIWPINDADLRSFTMERAGEKALELVKKDDASEWELAAGQQSLPPSFRVDKLALSSLVRAAASIRASAFLDDEKVLFPDAEAKNRVPSIVISAKDKDQKEYTFKVYHGENDKLFLTTSGNPQIYEIAKPSLTRIDRRFEDMRDFSLMSFDKDSITKISLSDKSGRILVEKKDGKWQITTPKTLPKDFEFDEKSPDDIVSIVLGLNALRVADSKKDNAASASWTSSALVELSDANGKQYRLLAGKSKTKNEYLIKGNIDDLTYVIAESKLSALTTGLETFKKVDFDLPAMDERTKGFDSLPVDIQRKLLDAAQKKNQ